MSEPSDEPIFSEEDATPMPAEPVKGACPHCDVVLRSLGTRQQQGDYGVCYHCYNVVIWDSGSWRMCSYDEAFLADQDAMVQVTRALFRPPLPGPEDTGP